MCKYIKKGPQTNLFFTLHKRLFGGIQKQLFLFIRHEQRTTFHFLTDYVASLREPMFRKVHVLTVHIENSRGNRIPAKAKSFDIACNICVGNHTWFILVPAGLVIDGNHVV